MARDVPMADREEAVVEHRVPVAAAAWNSGAWYDPTFDRQCRQRHCVNPKTLTIPNHFSVCPRERRGSGGSVSVGLGLLQRAVPGEGAPRFVNERTRPRLRMAEQSCRRQQQAGQYSTDHLLGRRQAFKAPANVFTRGSGRAEIGTHRRHIAFEPGQTDFHIRIMRPASVGSKHRITPARHRAERSPLTAHSICLRALQPCPHPSSVSCNEFQIRDLYQPAVLVVVAAVP